MKQSLAKNIIIRQGYGQDIASIMPIMERAFDPEYGEAWNGAQCISMLSLPYTQLIIAEDKDEVYGFAFTRGICEDEELLMLAIEPDKRRIGVASALMQYIISDAVKNARTHIFLEMRENNVAALFYKEFRFEQIGIREKYYKGLSGKYYNAITKRITL